MLAWERVCLPKATGGYNITNIQVSYKAATAKTFWDIAHKADKMWIKWIHLYYIKGQNIFEMNIPNQAIWMVKKILGARDDIKQIQRPTV